MTIRMAQEQLVAALKTIYDVREAGNITDWVLEHVTGKKRIDRLLDKDAILAGNEQDALERIQHELLMHRPVQYVLGEAWFAGMRFLVNENVLIPRPETEELVKWAEEEMQRSKVKSQKKILDIGTGSGCIPISLKKVLTHDIFTAIDISEEALSVAKENALTLHAAIHFLQVDFLDENTWQAFPEFDLIVSNPPYIREKEKTAMADNVLEHEPHIALFVPDNDPLLFYRKIAGFAKTHLAKDGVVLLEINEALGQEMIALYEQAGYTVELRKDMQGKDRMMKAVITN